VVIDGHEQMFPTDVACPLGAIAGDPVPSASHGLLPRCWQRAARALSARFKAADTTTNRAATGY
jgi:hypothetical protein